MQENRPSLPEVVTVRKRPRIPRLTLNKLSCFHENDVWIIVRYIRWMQRFRLEYHSVAIVLLYSFLVLFATVALKTEDQGVTIAI